MDRRHREAIGGSQAGLPAGHFYGPSTLSADGTTLYLFIYDTPTDAVTVRGLCNNIQQARVVGDGRTLAHQTLGERFCSLVIRCQVCFGSTYPLTLSIHNRR